MKKQIVIIKHTESEGPGSIADHFRNTAFDLRTVELGKGEPLPADLSEVAAVIAMGGPMNVYEEEKYPFLKSEDLFLTEVLRLEMPFLGICLGAQLLAKACGAAVKKAPAKELGWCEISMTESADRDILFRGLDKKLEVFQWHEDTFGLPDNGVLLASAEVCRHQAFRAGKNAYGLQFHIEVTPDMIWSWFKGDETVRNSIEMLIGAYKRKDSYEQQARSIYNNFQALVTA